MKPLIFLEPVEATQRLNGLTHLLHRQIAELTSDVAVTPLISYCIALEAQSQAIKHLNEFFEVGVPWDDEMGLPSSPSLAADVRTYSERLGVTGEMRGLLLSFSEWTLFKREEMKCACGWSKNKNGNLRFRTINADIMINTLLKTEDRKLKIKQLVGVGVDDADHLAHHYEEFSRQSSAVGDLMIIMESENYLSLDHEEVRIETVSLKRAKNFVLGAFSNMLAGFLNFQLAGN